ncbi:hypothetical protein KUD11_10430 [Roseovarius sp. LXJ103]|nr:hypothetical protein [Roseovarius carneus]PWE37225.1 hypothetical protein DD563_04530 [Pelagicola sp. LXJ1103]
MGLTGCSGFRDSAANPATWFSGERAAERRASREAGIAADATTNPLIPERRASIFRRNSGEEVYEGTAIYAVSSVSVEPASGGSIIKATGISLRQGAYDVRLMPENDGNPVDGVLTYRLEALQPTDRRQGPEQTRRVSAADFLSTQTLAGVQSVRVIGATNSQTARAR